MKKKSTLAFLLQLWLLIAPVSCVTTNPPASAPIRVDEPQISLRFTIWSANEAHLALLNGFAEAYQKTHPTITVQFDVIPPEHYTEKISNQLAGSNPPDAGWVREDSAPALIKAGVLADLAPTLKLHPTYDLADLSESALHLWQADAALYGIPFSNSPYLILYNRDLFDAAGVETPDILLSRDAWTWEALAKAAKRIAAASHPGIYGFESKDAAVYSSRVWQTLEPIMWAYGGDTWSADGTRCLLNSAESVAAVQLYHDMVFVDHSAVPPGQQADFFAGQSAMTLAQLSRVARLKNAPFTWAIVPLPRGPAGDTPVIGQAAISVFNAGKHQVAAIDFVTFMTNKENVMAMAEFFPPARTSILESDALLRANPLIEPESMQQSVVAAIKKGRVLSTHVEFPLIDLTAQTQFGQLWTPDADVAAIMTEVCEAITPYLHK